MANGNYFRLLFDFYLVTLTVTIKKIMSASAKLSTAVKAMCYLAEQFPEPKNSSEISKNIQVNASKLRKVLSYLVKCDLIRSTKGKSGGFVLNRQPEEIDLQEIYCAVEERKAFHLDFKNRSVKQSKKSVNLLNFFLDLFADIQVNIEDRMKMITLKQIIESINKT